MVLQRQSGDCPYHAGVVDEPADGKEPMRRNLMARTAILAAALALVASTAASAQFDEEPLPQLFDGVETTVVLNATSDAVLNAVVDATARAAHEAIGGRIGGRRNGYTDAALPDTRATVRAGLDAAADGGDLVVISGGDSQSSMGFVSNYPNTVFIDVGQPLPCVDGNGRPDNSGACEGGEFAIPANYSAIQFEVEDPAYLAGVVAAAASERNRIGIISGLEDCTECNRYIEGFTRGALSIKPDLDIQLAFLADDSEEQAFTDGTSARTFAEAFIDVYQPDVLLPVAEGASISMIEAACAGGILAIGTGVDVSERHPDLAECVLASVTKDVETAVRRAIYDFSSGEIPRLRSQTLVDEGVALTEEWRTRSGLPVAAKEQYQDARDALITGAVESCPEGCSQPSGPRVSDGDPEPDPEADGGTEGEPDPGTDGNAGTDD
jgi:basic membrane lipoprotein Med (substrate-binding protein (PBP1-ABC) superfamily)